MMQINNHSYGIGDSSYQAARGLAGISKLVGAFYDQIDSAPEARKIRAMHPADLSLTRKKLTFFLSGWLGGPRLYAEHFGSINIPTAHCTLPVGEEERDAWLFCMEKALQQQDFEAEFKGYLLAQLRVPAERIRQVCSANI